MKAQDGTPVVVIDRWEPAREAYRCPALGSAGAVGPTYGPYFDKGVVMTLDGSAHVSRRRTLGRLLDNSAWLRDEVLIPTVEHNLGEVFANPDSDGVTRMDLVPFNMRVAQQMSATMIGLDGVRTTAGVDELLQLVKGLSKSEAKYELIYAWDVDTVLPRALAARQRIHDEYYLPAAAKRRELIAGVRAGELAADALPNDLITLLLQAQERGEIDEETAFREILLMLTAGTLTTALSTTWSVHELLGWFETHPEDRPLATDREFLLRAFNESLRLHPGQGANLRRATEDVALCADVHVREGEYSLLYKQKANRDEEVFGEDANEFNPRREMPQGINEYGLSFGNGPHKCFGMPLVIGTRSTEGIALQLLIRLLEAGVRPDPDRPPKKYGGEHQNYDQWDSYPLILDTHPDHAAGPASSRLARA